MHEVALAQELLSMIEQVARDNDARSVASAMVELGELSCVVPEALAFAFEVVRGKGVAANCTLQFDNKPLLVRCTHCRYEGRGQPHDPGCPQCRRVPLEVVSGRQMRLVSIDVD